MRSALISLFVLTFFINPVELNSQTWINYEEEDGFPSMTWNDMKDAFHPTFDKYSKKVSEDYERTKKAFGFKSYWFDTEQGDDLSDFTRLIESVLSLLPESCKYKISASYTDDETDRWTVDVMVNEQAYRFSTQAIGGIFMDTENLHGNLNKILSDHAPGYEIIIPDLFYGQETEILIERKEVIQKAGKAGFPYPPFKIEWREAVPKNWNLYFPDCKIDKEDELIGTYIKAFNELYRSISPEKKLTREIFHICNIEGNGQLFIYLNGRVIGTPSKFKRKFSCDFTLPEFIFGYVLAKLSGCTVYLENTKEKKRQLLTLDELKAFIEKRI